MAKKVNREEFLNRQKELFDKLGTTRVSTADNSTLHLVKEGADNKMYAIVQEQSNYFIKECTTVKENLLSEDFNYIGGLENKMN